MNGEKYRSLMVTPAFLEARKRKEKNDATHGRVLPPSSAVLRPKTKPSSDVKPNSSPPRLKLSLEQDSNRKIYTATHSAGKRERTNPWEVNISFMGRPWIFMARLNCVALRPLN